MKRTWRMKLGQVRVVMYHARTGNVWSGAAYRVSLSAAIVGPETQAGRGIDTTMTPAQARSLARVLVDMADAADKQNLHAGYRVDSGDPK
jgi:hypothetical protein